MKHSAHAAAEYAWERDTAAAHREGALATIRDVARACGVSAMTVSAVLNEKEGRYSTETRKRVLNAVRELGYQPNAVARGLTRRRMNTLGVIVPTEEKPVFTSERYFGPILNGIFVENKNRRQRTLLTIEHTYEDVERNLSSYMDGFCDGLVFLLAVIPSAAYEQLMDKGMPFVLIGETRPEPYMTTVDLDNVRAGYDATRLLLDHGHRRITMLSGDAKFLSSSQREAGYRRAMAEAGLDETQQRVVPGRYAAVEACQRTRKLLQEPGAFPTAFFAADDAIAQGIWRAVTDAGLRVPEDVSIVGINDDEDYVSYGPGLTTIRQPLQRIGEVAVDLVLAQIEQGVHPGQKVELPGEFVVRGSVTQAP